MINNGLEKEVKMLAKKYGWDLEAMTGIGYREWRDCLPVETRRGVSKEGLDHKEKTRRAVSLQQIKDQIKIDTCQYAKRQMTWFKRDKEIHWISGANQAEKLVKKFLEL